MLNESFQFVKEKYLTLNSFFNNLIIAAIIFVVGLVVGRLAGSFIKRILKELEINKIIKKSTNVNVHIEENLGDAVSYIIYFFAAIMALTQLGLTTTVLTMIAAAVLIIIVLAFILGIKDFIPNLIAGFIIYRNQSFKVGDEIEVSDVKGKVVSIKLIETELKSGSDNIFIPNSTIIKSKLKIIKNKK